MQKKYFLLIMFVFVCAQAIALAQGATTAKITGVVLDAKGQPIMSASVVAVHEPTGTKSGQKTNKSGRFNLVGLRTGGPYTVTVSMLGQKKQVFEEIYLKLDQEFTLEVNMEETAVQSKGIVVEAERNEIMNSSRTGASQNVTSQEIDALPTISRSIHDYTRLSPLITSSTGDGSNVGGRNAKYNNIQVDGAVMSDAFGLSQTGTPGGMAGAEPISLDAIEEFQVNIAPFDVRQGGFTGGLINAITRGGSNKYKGSIFFFGRNQTFMGLNPKPDSSGKHNKYPDFDEYQLGGRFGGPIIKDKLFFFASAEMKNRNQSPDAGLIGEDFTNEFPVSKETMQQIKDIFVTKYNYNPGGYGGYTAYTKDVKLFLRFDMNLNDENRLTLRHNFVNGSRSSGVSRSATSFTFDGAEYMYRSMQNQTVLQLNTLYSNLFANEARLAFTAISDKRDIQGDPFPSVSLYPTSGSGKVYAGIENYSQANTLDQRIVEFTDNLSYFWNNHTFTVGTSNQFISFDNLYLQDYFGTYSFSNIEALAAGTPSSYKHTYSLDSNDLMPHCKFSYLQLGFYAQDEMVVNTRLKLTAGVRVDMFAFPEKPKFNPEFAAAFPGYSTDKLPNPVAISPRVGVNYDMFGDKKIQLRGGIGLFSGRTPGVWISNQYSNNGMEIAAIEVSGQDAPAFNPDPYNQPIVGALKSEIAITDPDFKMPQLFRANAAVDVQLPQGFVFTVEGILGKTVNDVLYKNINLQYQKDTAGNQVFRIDGRPVYGNTPVSSRFNRVILMTNTSEGFQNSLTFQLQKQFGQGLLPGLSCNLSYTYSHAKDINSNASSSRAISSWQYNYSLDPNNPELAVSDYDIPHRILANASYRLNYANGFATTIGLLYEGRSGSPYSLVYYGNANNDNAEYGTNNDLCYIPTGPNDPKVELLLDKTQLANGTTKEQVWASFEEYIKQIEGIEDYRGKVAPRNAFRAKWRNQFDLRLSQIVPLFDKKTVEITLDFVNFLNWLNSDWGRIEYISYNSVTMLTYVGTKNNASGPIKINFNPKYTNIYQYSDVASRWQMQLGIRVNL